MNKTNLEIYFPHIYNGVLEFDTLVNTENKLFDDLNIRTTEVEENQFVLTANSKGLEVYERMLNIIVNIGSDTIQFRRDRIINRLSSLPPYTIRELRNRLNLLIGADNYELDVIYDEHKLILNMSVGAYGKLNEVVKTLITTVPANMDVISTNNLEYSAFGTIYLAPYISDVLNIELTSEMLNEFNAEGTIYRGSTLIKVLEYEIN